MHLIGSLYTVQEAFLPLHSLFKGLPALFLGSFNIFSLLAPPLPVSTCDVFQPLHLFHSLFPSAPFCLSDLRVQTEDAPLFMRCLWDLLVLGAIVSEC